MVCLSVRDPAVVAPTLDKCPSSVNHFLPYIYNLIFFFRKMSINSVVPFWFTLRVTTDSSAIHELVKKFLISASANSSYIMAAETGSDTEKDHVHCLFHSTPMDNQTPAAQLKALRVKFRYNLKDTDILGNTGNYSLKPATNSFECAAGYTVKDGNILHYQGISFQPEQWPKYIEKLNKEKELMKRRYEKQTADKSVKHKALKRCRDEGVKPYMREVIGKIIWTTVKDADVIYSMKQMQDLAGYIKMALTTSPEDASAQESIEQIIRFI